MLCLVTWCVAFVGFSRIFLLGILIVKGLTARRLYKSFGVKVLNCACPTDTSYLQAPEAIINNNIARQGAIRYSLCNIFSRKLYNVKFLLLLRRLYITRS
jgi:hypothetical protein